MNIIKKWVTSLKLFVIALGLSFSSTSTNAQEFILEAPTTLHPSLQELGTELMKNKTGSIVAINPANGEIICMVTNSPLGSNETLAVATAYPPGSVIKPANALTFLSEGIATANTRVGCTNGFRDGNIKVGCHKHYSPLAMEDAIAISCNTWFLKSYIGMLNNKRYASKEIAITAWNEYMRSMGLGSPLGTDIANEKGGLLANVSYLNRRYKNGWDAKTIMWAGMGQGDITVTPLQLANLAASIANRGFFYTPHIHKDCDWNPLSSRFLKQHQTMVSPISYNVVINGMRKCVTKGTASAINTPRFTICGKTGTAENAGKDHSVFIGFAPMTNPKIAISVYIEHGGWGSDVAAPIAALIMEKYLKGNLSAKSQTVAKRIISLKTTTE